MNTINKTLGMQEAIFAAGCFWGVEAAFRVVSGVKDVEVGYIGGNTEDPTYEEVCTDTTGHAEAVRVMFDPSVVSYRELVEKFFTIHDPTKRTGKGSIWGDSTGAQSFTIPTSRNRSRKLCVTNTRRVGCTVSATL